MSSRPSRSTNTSPGASRSAQVPRSSTPCAARRPAHGREVSFGIRLHLIVRETEDEAWAAADKLIGQVSDEAIAARKRNSPRKCD